MAPSLNWVAPLALQRAQLVVLNKGFVEEYTVLTSDFIQTCLDHNLLSAESDDLLAETPLQTISILSSGHIWGGIALVNERELLNRRSVTFVEAAELPIARYGLLSITRDLVPS